MGVQDRPLKLYPALRFYLMENLAVRSPGKYQQKTHQVTLWTRLSTSHDKTVMGCIISKDTDCYKNLILFFLEKVRLFVVNIFGKSVRK